MRYIFWLQTKYAAIILKEIKGALQVRICYTKADVGLSNTIAQTERLHYNQTKWKI